MSTGGELVGRGGHHPPADGSPADRSRGEQPRPLAQTGGSPQVEVRRSRRRRRTVSAYREGDTIVVSLPHRFTRAEERRWVAEMVADVQAREARARRRGPRAGDAALQRRVAELARQYLPEITSLPTVRWVGNMQHRWASCTPSDLAIRVSDRLRDLPSWVLDYVLVHELAHLLRSGHDEQFWNLVERFEQTSRARGFLEGFVTAQRLGSPNPAGEQLPESAVDGEPAQGGMGETAVPVAGDERAGRAGQPRRRSPRARTSAETAPPGLW